MALNFPSNPNIGDTYTAANGIEYKWDGNGWVVSCNGGGTGTDLGISERTSTSLDITSSTGTDVTVPEATGTLAGVMTAAHQAKVELADTSLQPDDIGTDVGDIVALEEVGGSPSVVGLPAVDGSQLTNVPWTDGSEITHWSNTSQTIISDNTTPIDLDSGHVIDLTLTADHNIYFESTTNPDTTFWNVIMISGGFTPTFHYTGATTVYGPDPVWDTDTTYWVSFQKLGSNVYWSERAMQ